MKANSKPQLKTLTGAIPIETIAPSDLPGVNQLLAENKAVLQVISDGQRSRTFVVPVTEKQGA